ncbi:ABC transporter ATP-binding protein [Desulfobacula sp.]|uniref:ABC transporter ATP-binding protein n=1 Tax=Desulfobacula sp. TaxID=2593537 RepID=UPI0025C49B7A|nr:ABC transporter ATP-binding protein [Desulfobacula sp.]MBC2705725.1 ABC transporter ATP-binding protein [Desulfobacula sp.]
MAPDIHPEEKEIKLANLALAKELWPFIRPYLWMLCLSTALVFLVTFFELLMPIFIQKALDGFIVPVGLEKGIHLLGFRIDSFQAFCILFFIFTFTSFVIDFFQALFMEYTGQKIILNLRCALFSHMTFLPIAFYDKNSSGRMVSRVAGDVENMNEMFTSILIFIFKDLVMMTGILVILFTLHIKLAFYLSVLVPVIMISIGLFSKILRNVFRTIRQKIAEINHSFSEAITGIKIIQTTSSQNRFMQRFESLNFEHFTAALFQIKIFSIFMPFIGFLGVLSVAIIIWGGSFEVIEKALTLGELVAFLTYMKLFFRPLRELSEKFNLLQSALASAERIISVLNNDKAKQRISKKRKRMNKISNVTFDQVNFSYDKNIMVLKNISFHLKEGNSIGIVGQTGSGKSSIINLITGFYHPDDGNILINHINQTSMNVKDIRSKTALVMQDPILFSGSIRENIKPSGRDLDASGLEKALHNANCDFLFEKFSGLDTMIEEGGRPLSSGEKQLVCIARAFAFNPDLIIFDEATSYMDSQSEQKVHDAMKKLMKGRLSIIIAHRLSTVKDCDTIILLRDGTIREKGSHHELVELKGEYYHFLKKEKI